MLGWTTYIVGMLVLVMFKSIMRAVGFLAEKSEEPFIPEELL